MKNLEIIQQRFAESIQTKKDTLAKSLAEIDMAAKLIINTINNGNKILICGNGGSAADAQHFAAELTVRYETKRRSLPAIALTTDSSAITAISNDFSFNDIFSRQISGLANPKDLLIAISTSGNSANIVNAVKKAKQKNMLVLALTGENKNKISLLLDNNDIEINIPSQTTGRIQETHILIIHCLCEIMDNTFI